MYRVFAIVFLLLTACQSAPQSTNRSSSFAMYGTYYGVVPKPDPARKISEQDCTKPTVPDGGNLLCK
jgi:hypothetical protein